MSRTIEQTNPSTNEGKASSSMAAEAEQVIEDREGAELGLDTVFDALRNTRRRRLLRYLNDHDGHVTLSDLAEHIAAIENDTTPEALDSQQRQRVYVGLYQSHLPKLDKMGVLTFDQQSGVVKRTPVASQLDTYLYDEESDTRLWKRYYMECIGVSALVLLLGAITGLVGAIVAVFLFVGISIGLAGLAAFHEFDQA